MKTKVTFAFPILPACFGLAFWLAPMLVPSASAAAADDNWPQWRGPLGSGVAPKANPPVTWSETTNLKWKVKIPGAGKSTPIVWGDQVFIQTAIPTGKKIELPPEPTGAGTGGPATGNRPPRGGGGPMQSARPNEVYRFDLLCLDRQTGKVLWEQTSREEVPHEGHHSSDGSFASASPVTDGEHVWAFFGSRGLHCYDLAGRRLWSQDLGRMRIKMSFGEGSSPALAGDALVINWDNEDGSFIVAVDKQTGKTLWKQPREEGTSWATPLVVPCDGKLQVVTAATSKIRSYDLATGKLVWECAGLTANVIPSPLAADGVVYAMSGYRGNAALAIRLGRTGDLTGTDAIVWAYKKNTPYVPSPLLYGNRLYFLANNNAVLTCLDTATGAPLIDAEKLEALQGVYAAPIGASGRIYLTGRNGATAVLKQADKLELLATNRLDDKIDASPAAVGQDLFLRGQQFLYCLAEP